MLPDSPDVEAVVLGEDGVIAGVREGMLLVDMSTIAPAMARSGARGARRARRRGGRRPRVRRRARGGRRAALDHGRRQRGGGRAGRADLRGARQGDDPHRRGRRGPGRQGRQPGRGRAHHPGGRRGADAGRRRPESIPRACARRCWAGSRSRRSSRRTASACSRTASSPASGSSCTARTWRSRCRPRARTAWRCPPPPRSAELFNALIAQGSGALDHSALVTLYRQLSGGYPDNSPSAAAAP